MASTSSVLNRVRMFEVGTTMQDAPATLSPAVSFSRRRLPSPSGSSILGTDSPSGKSSRLSPLEKEVKSPSVLARYKYPAGDLSLTLSSPVNQVTSPGRLPIKRLELFDSPRSRASPLQEQNTWKSGRYNQEMAKIESKPSKTFTSCDDSKQTGKVEMRDDEEEALQVASWKSPRGGGVELQRPPLSAHDENREPPPAIENTPTARLKARTNLAMRRRGGIGTPTHSQSPSKRSDAHSSTTFLAHESGKVDDQVGLSRTRSQNVAHHLAKRTPQTSKVATSKDALLQKNQPSTALCSSGTSMRMEGLKRNLEDASVVMRDERESSAGSNSSARSSLSQEELKSVAKRALEISNGPATDTRARMSSLRQKIQYQQRANKKAVKKPTACPETRCESRSEVPSDIKSPLMFTASKNDVGSSVSSSASQSQHERNISRASKMTNALQRKRPFSPASPSKVEREYDRTEARHPMRVSRGAETQTSVQLAKSGSSQRVEFTAEEGKKTNYPSETTKTSARIALLAAARKSKTQNPMQQRTRDLLGTASTEESDVTMNADIVLPYLSAQTKRTSTSIKHIEINKTASTEGSDITTTSSAVSRNSSRIGRASSLRVVKLSDQGGPAARLRHAYRSDDSSDTVNKASKATPAMSRMAALQKLSADPAMKRFPRSGRNNSPLWGTNGAKRVIDDEPMDTGSSGKQFLQPNPQRSPLNSAMCKVPNDEVSSIRLKPVIDEILPSKSDVKTETDDILASFRSYKAAAKPVAIGCGVVHGPNALKVTRPRIESLQRSLTGPGSSLGNKDQEGKLNENQEVSDANAPTSLLGRQHPATQRFSSSAIRRIAHNTNVHRASDIASKDQADGTEGLSASRNARQEGSWPKSVLEATMQPATLFTRESEEDEFLAGMSMKSPHRAAVIIPTTSSKSPLSLKRQQDELPTLHPKRQSTKTDESMVSQVDFCQLVEAGKIKTVNDDCGSVFATDKPGVGSHPMAVETFADQGEEANEIHDDSTMNGCSATSREDNNCPDAFEEVWEREVQLDDRSEALDCQTYISSDTSEAFHRKQGPTNKANPETSSRQSLGGSVTPTSFSPFIAQDFKTSARTALLTVQSVDGRSQTHDSQPLPLQSPSRASDRSNARQLEQTLLAQHAGQGDNRDQGKAKGIAESQQTSSITETRPPNLSHLTNSCSSNYFQHAKVEQINDALGEEDAFFEAEDFPFDCAPSLLADVKITISQTSRRSRKQIVARHMDMRDEDAVSGHLNPAKKADAVPFQSSVSAFSKPVIAGVVNTLHFLDDEDIFSGLEDEMLSLCESNMSELKESSVLDDQFRAKNLSQGNKGRDDLDYETPPPPPPQYGPPNTIIEPSAAVNTVNSDITSSLMAGDVTKEPPEWVPPEDRHTIMEDPYEDDEDETPLVNQSSIDSKSKSLIDNESLPYSANPKSFHSNSTKQTRTNSSKPTADESHSAFKTTTIPGASSLFRMGWDFFDSFTTNLCRVPGSSSGVDDFPAGLYQSSHPDADPISGTASDSSTVATTNNGSYATASQLSLNLQERRVWDEWDRRDSVNALNKAALLASASNNSDERLDRATERDKARDKLLSYASTAQAALGGPLVSEEPKHFKNERSVDASTTFESKSHLIETSVSGTTTTNSTFETQRTVPTDTTDLQTYETNTTFDVKTKSLDAPTDGGNIQRSYDEQNSSQVDGVPQAGECGSLTSTFMETENRAVAVNARSKPKEVAPTQKPTPQSLVNVAAPTTALSLRERRILEKFSSRLSSTGLEVLKQNRDRKWQSRFVTISKEVTWLSPEESSHHHSGDRFPCPRGILWLKKFPGKSKDVSLSNIDKLGRGGLAFSQLISASVSDVKSFGSTLTRRQHAMFKGSSMVCLDYMCGSSTRSVLLLCKNADNAEFLATGMNMISNLLKRRAGTAKEETPKSMILSANSTAESHSLSVSVSEESH